MSEPRHAYLPQSYISPPARLIDRQIRDGSLVPRLHTVGLRLVVSNQLAIHSIAAREAFLQIKLSGHYVIAVLSRTARSADRYERVA